VTIRIITAADTRIPTGPGLIALDFSPLDFPDTMGAGSSKTEAAADPKHVFSRYDPLVRMVVRINKSRGKTNLLRSSEASTIQLPQPLTIPQHLPQLRKETNPTKERQKLILKPNSNSPVQFSSHLVEALQSSSEVRQSYNFPRHEQHQTRRTN